MPLKGLENISFAYKLNHFEIDKPLKDIFKKYLNKIPDLNKIGDYVSKEIYEIIYRIDRFNKPIHVMWNLKGEREDYSWIDFYERKIIEDLILKFKINKFPFENKGWHEHFSCINLIGDPGIGCIVTITIQTAYALWKYGNEEIKEFYKNLIGIKRPLMIGATWFTEIQGGSDLGANLTSAERKNEKLWKLNGYKYFASGAGISDIALCTARIKGFPLGAKGISLFAVPRLNKKKELNFFVRRLKDKIGTISVPTGEVEFLNSEGYLLGEANKGIYYVLENLMISRISNSHGAIGIARKAYLESLLYSIERKAFGKRIVEHKLIQRDLLEMECLIEAGLILVHETTNEFKKCINEKPPYSKNYNYSRLLTHIVKNFNAEISSKVTKLSMEIFGGIGFLSEFPIEKWHREALITSIWEGTSNIQALDMLEVIFKKEAYKSLIENAEKISKESYDKKVSNKALKHLKFTISKILNEKELAEFNSKDYLISLAFSFSTILLENLAENFGKRYHLIAKSILEKNLNKKNYPLLKEKDLYDIISLGGKVLF